MGKTDEVTLEEISKNRIRFDPRFPFQNQTYHCWYDYCSYHKCMRLLNDGCKCALFWRQAQICPLSWLEKWDDQRKAGIFAGDI